MLQWKSGKDTKEEKQKQIWTCLLNLEWVDDISFSRVLNKNKLMRKNYYANYDYIHPTHWYAFKHSGITNND